MARLTDEMGFSASPANSSPSTKLGQALVIAVGALILSLFFQSPHLWVFVHPVPGSTYWDRGLGFVAQCNAPLGAPTADAGLTWRLAPVILAKALGLHGMAPLVIPWIGLILLLTQCAWISLSRIGDFRIAALTTALIGTTGATLTVTGWLGMNDAWYAAALLAIALQPSTSLLILAAIVGPWIDERFILAAPLALFIRSEALGSGWLPRFSIGVVFGAIALHVILRLGNVLHVATNSSPEYWRYVFSSCTAWWPWLTLGWFMGLRAAWILVVIAIAGNCRREDLRAAWWPAALAIGPMLAMAVLASDTSRTPTMLLPLVLFGLERLVALHGLSLAKRVTTFLLVANLLMPAMNVTHKNGDVINMLPIEVVRWARPH